MSKRSLNKTLLIGCLGADPELRYTLNDGTAVATLRVATNETWKEKASGERKQRTEWHRVVCFGRLAEIVSEYLTKGSYVFFEGRMQTRQYTDRDNTERSITEVIASDMRILDARNRNEGEEPLTGPSMTRYRYERRNRTRDKRWNDPSPAAGVEEGTGRRAVRALA